MELTFFGLNVFLLVLVWRYIIRKTILDNSRDKLFDLRDEVRATFIRNGWDLGSPQYKNLRDLINGHLRFTEEFSLWKLAFFEASIKQNKTLQNELHERVQKIFSSADPMQAKFTNSVRRRAVAAVMNFSIFGSGILLFVLLLVAPFVAIAKIIAVVNRGINTALVVFTRSVCHLGTASAIVMASSVELIANRLFAPDVFETYSYKIGTA